MRTLFLLGFLALAGCGLCLGGGNGDRRGAGIGPCPPGYHGGPVRDDERRRD